MDQTNHLGLPYIMPSQAQKHVTHNEALRVLDAVVQLSVLARGVATSPAFPSEGDRYIVPEGADGAWAGKAGEIAVFRDGVWAFHTPQAGWRAWVAAEALLLAHDGANWRQAVETLPLLGINATADAANPLALKGPASLFDNDGSGHQLKVNKAAGSDTASLLFQDGYSGRAEMGLAGDDDFRIKTSGDGSAWNEALVADGQSGAVRFPGGLAHAASRQPLHSVMFTPGGDGTVSFWRIDETHAQSPRTATITGVTGDIITLNGATAPALAAWSFMAGVSYIRIWNVSKALAASAWVKASPADDQLQVLNGVDVADWTSGEILQIGDPESVTPNRCIAIDISPMLQAIFGTVFRQTGLIAKATLYGDAGSTISLSPSGVGGSFVFAASAGIGDGVTVILCTEASPVSQSNLVFLRETIATSAGVELLSAIAVFA